MAGKKSVQEAGPFCVRAMRGVASLVLASLALALLAFALCCLLGVFALAVLALIFAFVANPSGFKEVLRAVTSEMRAITQKLTELGELLAGVFTAMTPKASAPQDGGEESTDGQISVQSGQSGETPGKNDSAS